MPQDGISQGIPLHFFNSATLQGSVLATAGKKLPKCIINPWCNVIIGYAWLLSVKAIYVGFHHSHLYLGDKLGTWSLCSLQMAHICHFCIFMSCLKHPMCTSNVGSFPVWSGRPLTFSSSSAVEN